MENLFKFFDELSLEEHHYWRIRGSSGAATASKGGSVELRWQRGKKPFSWSFRAEGESDWQDVSTTLLESYVTSRGIEAETLKNEITQQILTQVVHAQMMIEAGEKLLGQQAVFQAYSQTKSFLESVRKLTEKMVHGRPESQTGMAQPTEKTSKPRLILVKKS